ncbi:hypothetical protein J2I46_28460 [Fibrella sp. HMF5405]|uniref:Lipoprotein n=1 Tax=Fibrella forsythiae TaxID=2817061 RepID=A0ABS3JRB6_9BACT|nr:hypothetical protein [Fibrella forsythiae]
MTGLLLACSSTDKKDPALEEAARYHEQATAIQADIEPKIEQIDSLKTVMMVAKMPATEARMATLDSLKSAFEEWEANLVEVPGMPHNHTHRTGGPHHGKHKHADATLKDLPADQMRDLQRETLNAIKQIQSRLETVTKPI